jgi:hypothetical protein
LKSGSRQAQTDNPFICSGRTFSGHGFLEHLVAEVPQMSQRTVYISDGTGITAETFGNALMAQFETKARHIRLPFVDSVDRPTGAAS